jgi:hypothetical protein
MVNSTLPQTQAVFVSLPDGASTFAARMVLDLPWPDFAH